MTCCKILLGSINNYCCLFLKKCTKTLQKCEESQNQLAMIVKLLREVNQGC